MRRAEILILDFGSQTSHLIARRVREARVYCQLVPPDVPWENTPKGFILSGGPRSVFEPGAPSLPLAVIESARPVLGICYGMQLLAHQLDGRVAAQPQREFGPAQLNVHRPLGILEGFPAQTPVWMSHGDQVVRLPPGFEALAETANTPVAAMGDPRRRIYGVQFHPEVSHTTLGRKVLENFLFEICDCAPSWAPESIIDESITAIRQQVGAGRALCAISGGVDSAVAALLAYRALGERLRAVFIDTGLMRANEPAQVEVALRPLLGDSLRLVDASREFLARLRGVSDPEEKRRRIGEMFIRILEREAAREEIEYLVQGTIYPDVIESRSRGHEAADKIKTHHNVGGLPADLRLKLIEPLRALFKDEVRRVGQVLGLPAEILTRHPFPGPGLAVRIIGEITPERLNLLRRADAIVEEEIRAAGYYEKVWMAFSLLAGVRSTGVRGDQRAYGEVIALRCLDSSDAMTAEWTRLPYELLARISVRLTNQLPEVVRVVYDITTKPPATMEWE